MKKITKTLLTIITALTVFAFASCGSSDPTDTPQEGTLVEVYSGSHTLSWSENLDITHDKFSTDMTALKVTFETTGDEACFKVTVSDPWTEDIVKAADGGTLAADNAVGISGSGSVTLTFNSGVVAKIVGEGVEGAWGGLTFQGQNAKITKVEMVK